MSWTRFSAPLGGELWEVDRDNLWILLKGAIRAETIRSRTRKSPKPDGPGDYEVTTEWSGVLEAVEKQTLKEYAELEDGIARFGGAGFVSTLELRRDNGALRTNEIEQMQREAWSLAQSSMRAAVERGEIALEALTVVRDLSAGILVGCATFFSGGAFAAVLGAGAVLKAGGKYEDTGNPTDALIEGVGAVAGGATGSLKGGAAIASAAGISFLEGFKKYRETGSVGSAALVTTSTFVVRAIPIQTPGVNYSAAEQRMLAIVGSSMDGMFTGVEAVVDGKSASVALAQAASQAGLGILLGSGKAKTSKIPMFSKTKINMPPGSSKSSADALDRIGGTALGKAKSGMVKAIPNLLGAPRKSGKVDFALSHGSTEISSDVFIKDYVLRRVNP